MNNQQELKPIYHLIGWPGAGRTRVKAQLEAVFAAHKIQAEVIEQPGLVWPDTTDSTAEFLLTVIDSRSKIDDQQELAELLQSGDALIFNFWQMADLGTQAWWKNQVSKIVADKPCIWLVQGLFTTNDLTKLSRLTKSNDKPYWRPLEILEYEMSKVVLDHLLMVLDGAQQNLGLQIWRAVGVVDSLEYSNLIAVELTKNRLDTFGLDEATDLANGLKVGLIKLQGYGLNSAEITSLLQASLAPGGSLVARHEVNNQVNW